MNYLVLKHTHVVLAITSITLFLIRAWASVCWSKKPSALLRVFAHGIDTALLGVGVTLAYQLAISPLSSPWFAAKVIAIAVYIGCGMVVMKAKARPIKALAMAMSILLIVGIFFIAITKNPNVLNMF